jgi:hypothetical protein
MGNGPTVMKSACAGLQRHDSLLDPLRWRTGELPLHTAQAIESIELRNPSHGNRFNLYSATIRDHAHYPAMWRPISVRSTAFAAVS